MDMLPANSNDVGVLSEWAWPLGEWEIITGDEVDERMQRVSDGTASGPVSHACPPGVLSGMSEFDAVRLARANGLPVLLDRQAAGQRLIHAGWDVDLVQRILDAVDSAHTRELLEAAVIDVLDQVANEHERESGRASYVNGWPNIASVTRLLCPFAAELDGATQ
ncbi:hypothetical protein MOQ72_37305 [Saccharopolyspora sp. K220]|uniref:hypothetical protein n=1 Tax=Saccharopolyspora soli TaxID=2926618 RepID=UPI001F5ACDC7|nr:hypothetical protein [Saccharopolyspora soli]MCI2423091.1 hypothetical protein [Saccharopolyspora soli]